VRLEVLSLQVHCGWVVERTFAWISHNRRRAKDYERLCSTGEVFIHATMIHQMARRPALPECFGQFGLLLLKTAGTD
jgi:hypothetical protein